MSNNYGKILGVTATVAVTGMVAGVGITAQGHEINLAELSLVKVPSASQQENTTVIPVEATPDPRPTIYITPVPEPAPTITVTVPSTSNQQTSGTSEASQPANNQPAPPASTQTGSS